MMVLALGFRPPDELLLFSPLTYFYYFYDRTKYVFPRWALNTGIFAAVLLALLGVSIFLYQRLRMRDR